MKKERQFYICLCIDWKGFSSTVGYCPNCHKPLINGNLLYENWMVEMASDENNKTTFDEWLVNTNKKTMESTHLKCSTHCDWPDCTLEGCVVKSQPNDEIQDDLWQESIKLWLHSETLDELKYRFRIERIK